MAGWLATLGKVAQTAKTAHSLKRKKSGKDVASAIVKRDPEEKKGAIIKSHTRIISKEKLLNVAPPAEEPDTEKTSSGGPLAQVLDNINETFGGMIKATKDESKLAKTQQKDAARRDDKDKKKKREGVLEKIGKTGATMVGKATAPVKGMWETLKTFFGNILIGSILTMILENWNKIVEQIEKAVEKIKEVWKMLEPILIPIWNVGKWFFVEGVKLTAQLMGIENADTSPVTDNLSAIMKKIPFLKGLFGGFGEVKKKLDGKEPKDDTDEKDPTIKEGVKESVEEIEGNKTTGDKGLSKEVPSTKVPPTQKKHDEDNYDRDGNKVNIGDTVGYSGGGEKLQGDEPTTLGIPHSQIAGFAEGVPYTFQQELQGMIRRHKHRTEELNEAIQSGEGVESTQRRHVRLTKGLIKYKNNNPKVFAQLSVDDKKYINSLNNTSVNFNKDLSISKTTSSLFQRDSTERKKSTVVMMQSSPPPGGVVSGGGNGGGAQIIAVGPTRNEIVNNSMKALITTKLS